MAPGPEWFAVSSRDLRLEFVYPGDLKSDQTCKKGGAAEGTRTPDPIITNDVLYQLSYSGDGRGVSLRTPAVKP